MKHQALVSTFTLALIAAASSLQAAELTPLDICVKSILQNHPGKMVSLSSEIEDGKSQYEIDIKGKDGKNWEVECDAKTGKVNRLEGEIDANSSEFKSKAKITLEQASKLALQKYPGKIIHNEFDLEKDGEISYEFIIKTNGGKMIEIEVDAESGKLAGEEEVLYHIGG